MTRIAADTDRNAKSAYERRWWALALLTVANLLVFASVTIVNVALPQAQSELGLSSSATRAVVTVYSLTFGTLILLGGRMADVLGLRRCLVAGLVGFAASSLLGGMADEAVTLLVARGLQGGAGAFVAATAVPLMSVIFPAGRERKLAFAALGVVMGIGTAGSFLLGGVLVELLSWRWCLFINVPLAFVIIAGVLVTTSRRPRTARSGVDVGGATLVSVALGALVIGLDRVTAWGWLHAGTIALLAGGVLGIGLFVGSLRLATQPLVPPQLMRNRSRVAGYIAAFFAGVAMFAGMFVLTSFMQETWDASPVTIGVAFLPFAVGAVITTALLPGVRQRVAPTPVFAAGLLIAAVAVANFILLGPDATYATGVLPPMLLLGSGGTIVMITAGDVATEGAGEHSGIAGSLVNSAQQVGAALGTALLTTVMSGARHEELATGAEPIVAAVAGYAHAGLVGASLLAVAAVLVLVILGRRHRRGVDG